MELSRWLQCVLMSCVVTAAVFAGLVFPASVAAQSPPPDRQVAITIDDLPAGNSDAKGSGCGIREREKSLQVGPGG